MDEYGFFYNGVLQENIPITFIIQIWHGRTIVFDPTRLTLEHGLYPHHISPNDIVFETQPRIFFRQAEHVFIKPGVEHEHNFTLLEPIPIAEEKLIKDGQPWVLHMCMDDMPHEFELYFSVNDWQYTTLLSSSVVSLSHYIEPYSVRDDVIIHHMSSCMHIYPFILLVTDNH